MFCGRVEDERVEEREEENERVSLKKSSQWGRLLASVVFTQTHEASIKESSWRKRTGSYTGTQAERE